MFKEIPKEGFYHLINYGPCVMITSAFEEKVNAAPIAWVTPVNDDPPLLGIAVADSHYTSEIILKTKEFVVNVPDIKMLPAMKICGKNSGRKMDKIKEANLSTEPGIKINVPHLTDCAGFIECRLKDALDYDGVKFFVSEVRYAGVMEELYSDNKITENAEIPIHIGSNVFAVPGKRHTF